MIVWLNPSVTTCHLPYILLCKTPRNATGHGRGEFDTWFCCCLCLLTPSPFGHSPYIPCRNTGGEDWYLILLLSLFFNPSVLRPPPLYFAAQNTEEEGEMYSPFASSSILYTTPRKAAGHGRGGVLKYPFDSGTWILILRVDFPIFFQNIGGREILFLSWSSIFYVVSGNYSTFSPVSRSGIGERPKERSSGEEGLKR